MVAREMTQARGSGMRAVRAEQGVVVATEMLLTEAEQALDDGPCARG